MKTVLLAYELVPEETIIALIETDEETVSDLKTIHGTFVNGHELTKEQQLFHSIVNDALGARGDWRKFVRKDSFEVPAGTTFIRAGFIL